ncbi:sodium:calcium antiporter [Brassicibacter mesophilus]|uniref:sodium:calcium antiporter n=1 Tax=Brassicibacter mesophilus TaxID=745119 RepID=UPI003D221FB0
MEAYIEGLVISLSMPVLALIVVVTLITLSKGADLLVNNSVVLSEEMGIPKMIIGATIVSLGTTLPETSVSVFAALQGNSSMALGNAVGSIICDTALILGISTMISPLPIKRDIVNRHGWLQFGAGVLLVLFSVPYSNIGGMFTEGGLLPQYIGFILIGLLLAYMYVSIKWAKGSKDEQAATASEESEKQNKLIILIKLAFGIALVIFSSKVLIPTVQEVAIRMNVPNSVIAATLVAFGTSLPELVTSVTATLKGHGELAIGNIIGADILNVLFVMGSSIAATKGGVSVPADFFTLYFPAMIFVLAVFRIGTLVSKDSLKRPFGFLLLATYVLVSVFSYI